MLDWQTPARPASSATLARLDRAALEVLPRLAPSDADWARVARATYLVRQSLRYQYPSPIRDLRQRLVLIPPPRLGDQHTLACGVDVSLPARRRDWTDGFGNRVVEFEVDTVDAAIGFEAWSLIERRAGPGPGDDTTDGDGTRGRPRAPANPAWARPTRLTTADQTLAEVADQLAGRGPGGLSLAERICDWVYRHMTYRHDATSIHTTAAAAWALGAGVCQDYAHIALALCRRCGLAARYVSGHLLGEGGSHAWIEVLLPHPDRPRDWDVVALDPTHNRRPGFTYLTVATGRDYRDVAPTSGTFRASVSGALSVQKQAALVGLAYRGD